MLPRTMKTVGFLCLAYLTFSHNAHALTVGVNGHDMWSPVYQDTSKTEATFQLLNSKNLRSYRVDVDNSAAGQDALTRLVALGKKYNITIRPMLYVDSGSANNAYVMAKKFAADIKIWELGNELNLRGAANFDGNINLMIQARNGIMRAAAETGYPLKTSINVTAALDGNVGLNSARNSYPFIDRAIAMGLQFDYITYHFYINPGDRAGGWIRTYLEPLKKYGKTVFLNETNCALIYHGDDGNSQACADLMEDLFQEIKLNYASLVPEVNMYELYDQTQIQGPEGHFGIMFNYTAAKKTLAVASKYSDALPAVPPPPPPPSQPAPGTTDAINFVKSIYNGLMAKNPAQAQLDQYVNALTQHIMTKPQVIAAIANSTEFANATLSLSNQMYVTRCYQGILGRAPDTGGLNFYTQQLNIKAITRKNLVSIMLNSTEFKNRTF